MVTEYERLLEQMLVEGRAKIEALKARKGGAKQLREQEQAMSFVEVELERYRRGMALFRSKNLPKVGRWGEPESDHHAAAAP